MVELLTYEPTLGVCDEVVVVMEAVAHTTQQVLVPVRLVHRHAVNLSLEPVQLLRHRLHTGLELKVHLHEILF